MPGSDGCPAKNKEDTYGFDWCPGDDELLAHVGKSGYRDPACDLADVPIAADDPHGPQDQRQSACDLEFGTSTGVMGLRKFPNPKFDRARWREAERLRLGTWKRLRDASSTTAPIEPPFLIGMACGACHIAFDPLNPPADPEHPTWENIDALVGNQYSRMLGDHGVRHGRRTASNGRSSRTRAPARSTPPPCPTTASTIRAR